MISRDVAARISARDILVRGLPRSRHFCCAAANAAKRFLHRSLRDTCVIVGKPRSVFDTTRFVTSGTRVAPGNSRMLKHGQSIRVGPTINTDIAVVWSESETRCIISWMVDRYRLRLLRGAVVLRNESAGDDRMLLTTARQWRAELSGALTRLSADPLPVQSPS